MALIEFKTEAEQKKFESSLRRWLKSEWADAVLYACGKLEEVLQNAAMQAVQAYYDTYPGKHKYKRTNQLPKAYEIYVRIKNNYDSFDIIGHDKILVNQMDVYHSIYHDEPALSSTQMESVVNYMLSDGYRPIPPHIKNPPYSSKYGEISITIPEFNNLKITGNSVHDIVRTFNDLDCLQDYVVQLEIQWLQPGFNNFIRSYL